MPSVLHEALLLLFRNRPALAPELLRDALHVTLPEYTEIRVESGEFTELQPVQYHADLVVLLYDNKPVLGIVVEAQLQPDDDKLFVWPGYSVHLRTRIRCPVVLLVVTSTESVAKWAAKPIHLGGGNTFTPLVLGPSGVPEVEDENVAKADPELAVLSAMAHGKSTNTDKSVRIALAAMAASIGLDEELSVLYTDLILANLGTAARKALQAMDPAKYEFQSEFARRYISIGRAEGEAEGEARGKAEGKAEVVLKQLTLRFGHIEQALADRVRTASPDDLERFAERVLTAATLEQVLS